MSTVNKSDVAGQAVLARFPNYAAEYDVQDITYSAMAGRLKRVANIEVSPEELFEILTSYYDDELSPKVAAKSRRISSWFARSVGRKTAKYLVGTVMLKHILIVAQLFLLGFIAKKVLLTIVKPSKTIMNETGVFLANWEEVVKDIDAIKDRAKKKGAS